LKRPDQQAAQLVELAFNATRRTIQLRAAVADAQDMAHQGDYEVPLSYL
jgi:hypothetical protein